jgi:hypothetical protein
VDLVEHWVLAHDGKTVFREWILLNPAIVCEFSADPKVLAPEIRKGLELLRNPGFHFDPKDVHHVQSYEKGLGFYSESGRSRMAALLEKYLAGQEGGSVPSFFFRCMTLELGNYRSPISNPLEVRQ